MREAVRPHDLRKPSRRGLPSPLCKRVDPGSPLRFVRGDAGEWQGCTRTIGLPLTLFSVRSRASTRTTRSSGSSKRPIKKSNKKPNNRGGIYLERRNKFDASRTGKIIREKISNQEAQIDALITVLSDIIAAHTVLHKDIRLASFLREYRNSDEKLHLQGGTTRVSASFFAARSAWYARLTEGVVGSPVFDTYWHRSIFWSREEKERSALKKIRQLLDRMFE